jgi:NADPH-dependent 2,4-dienoyl-CoA reductase/sulfur reductase-like enzyme
MNGRYEIVVIGAGPAGMAAATACAQASASTLLLDEQLAPGGQIYRSIERPAISDRDVLGADYYQGEGQVAALRQARLDYVNSASVWEVTPEREIGVSVGGKARIVVADQLIIATGAQERPFAIDGWTLPGVMTVGAAQILLKKSGLVAENPVFAGSGPLLYLTARQYLRAGANVKAVLDTTPTKNYWRSLSRAFGALRGLSQLKKGWQWIREIKAAGVPVISGIEALRAYGDHRVRGVDYCTQGHHTMLETDHLFLHQGVVPNNHLTMSMNCEHAWCDRQQCWRVVTDEWGGTSLPGIAVAGDAADIGGATCARHRGTIAALGALRRLGRIGKAQRNRAAASHRRALAAEQRLRAFLDLLYQPSPQFLAPNDPRALVCRCEEVNAGKVREVIAVGCEGPNQLKSFTRCGMGPCQGRMCGLTVAHMLSAQLQRPLAEIGYYRVRQPIKPIGLGELASLAEADGAAKAPTLTSSQAVPS